MPDQLQPIVQRMIDAGEPEENIATVIQHFTSQEPPKDQGVMTGVMNTLPTPSKLMGFIRSVPENIRKFTDAQKDPVGAADEMIANRPNTSIGKVFNGRPYEGMGEILGGAGQAALGEAIPRMVRGRLLTPAAETATHLDLNTPVKAGSLTPDQIMERIRAGNAADAAGTPMPRVQRPPKTMIQPKTAGSGSAASTATPEAAATPAPAPAAQPQIPDSWKQFVQPEDMPTQSGAGPAQSGPFAPGIKVLTPKETPTSWTPEAARARLEMDDWHSGATPGTPEAQQMSGLHKFDAELKSRFAHQLQNQNGNISYEMLKKMGVPLEVAKYLPAHHYGGNLGVGLMAGTDAARLAAAYPMQSAQALRAALLANLASGPSTEGPNGQR